MITLIRHSGKIVFMNIHVLYFKKSMFFKKIYHIFYTLGDGIMNMLTLCASNETDNHL